MNIAKRIKDNRFIRGVYFFLNSYVITSKRKFAYFGENVTLSPPFYVVGSQNVSIGPNVDSSASISVFCRVAVNCFFMLSVFSLL